MEGCGFVRLIHHYLREAPATASHHKFDCFPCSLVVFRPDYYAGLGTSTGRTTPAGPSAAASVADTEGYGYHRTAASVATTMVHDLFICPLTKVCFTLAHALGNALLGWLCLRA